jgi:hypothetical protein
MNKIFAIVFAALVFFSQEVFAKENKMFFHSHSECVSTKDALYYEPALKRPAPKEWKRTKLLRDTCVQMQTVQGLFDVLLKEGTELAQNPKTNAWHHTLCTNWTNWQLPEVPAKEELNTEVCHDCNKVVEQVTVVKEILTIQCADGSQQTFNGEKKVDASVVCPKFVVRQEVETKTEAKSQAAVVCKDCIQRPTQSELNKLCWRSGKDTVCQFDVAYMDSSKRPAKACYVQSAKMVGVIIGAEDGSEDCCNKKEALLAVLNKKG